jgi:heat-inducible transcriptional repressor
MTPRQEALLASIINEYVQTAEPLSSKLLEKMGFFGLSSATIRGEMCELENLGYLAQLHTSSGRIPTDMAYRLFVDNMIGQESYEVPSDCKKRINKVLLTLSGDPREINKTVAQLLSELTDNLVIAGVPEQDDFFKVGLSSLFEMPEFREFDKVFKLTSFFDEFESLFSGIEKEFFGDDFKIFIGNENPVKNIRDETVMFAKYTLPGNYACSLTLIGPTRMDYGKNIGLIKYTTDELNKLAKNI